MNADPLFGTYHEKPASPLSPFLLPNGNLEAWNGSAAAAGTVLANLGANAWNDFERVVTDFEPAPSQTLITLD